MKKSVILIISVIYLASVLIVGLMGIRMKMYNIKVPINEIRYIAQGVAQTPTEKTEDNGSVTTTTLYKKTADKGYTYEACKSNSLTPNVKYWTINEYYSKDISFNVTVEVYPDNATSKNFTYLVADEDQIYKDADGNEIREKNYTPKDGDVGTGYLTVNDDGSATVTFITDGVFEIVIKATDSSGTETRIKFNAVKI